MTEKNRNSGNWGETLSRSPIGSPESRAAARALLQGPGRLPYIVIEYAKRSGRDESGRQVGPLLEPVRALTQVTGIAPDREYVREPGEARAHFVRRVAGTLPALSQFPPCIILFPPQDPEEKTYSPA